MSQYCQYCSRMSPNRGERYITCHSSSSSVVVSQVTPSLNPTESTSLQVSEYFTDWVKRVCNNSTSAMDADFHLTMNKIIDNGTPATRNAHAPPMRNECKLNLAGSAPNRRAAAFTAWRITA